MMLMGTFALQRVVTPDAAGQQFRLPPERLRCSLLLMRDAMPPALACRWRSRFSRDGDRRRCSLRAAVCHAMMPPLPLLHVAIGYAVFFFFTLPPEDFSLTLLPVIQIFAAAPVARFAAAPAA